MYKRQVNAINIAKKASQKPPVYILGMIVHNQYIVNALEELGVKTTDIVATGDCSAAVYYNKTTNKYTATVWNPTNKTKVVTFNNKSGKIGTATTVSYTHLDVYKRQDPIPYEPMDNKSPRTIML